MQQQVIASTRYVLLLPVQFVLFVVKLPFVLLSLVFCSITQAVCAVLSVPIAYICKAKSRAQLLWDSVRCLPPPCGHHCITAAANQDVDLSAVPHTSPTLGLKEGRERVELAVRSATKRRPAIWKTSLYLDITDPERLGQSRIELGKPSREVLLSYLVRLLLQPSTPSDTEEEEDEQPSSRTQSPIDFKDPESEKALNLILDLLRLSQSYMYTDRHKQKGKHGKQKRSPKHKPHEVLDTNAPLASSDEDSPHDQPSSRCESPAVDEDENQPPPVPHRQSLTDSITILSPLNESPEHSGGSTSSLAEDTSQPSRDTSADLEGSPKAKPDLKDKPVGVDHLPTSGVQTSEQACNVPQPEQTSSGLAIHTNEGEFDSIPRSSPALGLKEGHDRRDLAGGLRRRPPSKGSTPSDVDPAAIASPEVRPHPPAVEPSPMTRLASPGRVSPGHAASGVKKSFALTANDQPPWMELIQKRKRNDSGSAAGADEPPVVTQTQPQAQAQGAEDGIYDTLQTAHVMSGSPVVPGPSKATPVHHRYLHESFDMDVASERKEVPASPALPPRKEKGVGLFRGRSGSSSSVPETEAAARADSGDKHHHSSSEQKWKLIGGSHKEKKENRERAASPKAGKKSKSKKASASSQGGASPQLHPSSSQLSVNSVPGSNDGLVLANPVTRQSKEWEKSQSTSRLDVSRKSQ